jgi:GGDEF domain-containing protein
MAEAYRQVDLAVMQTGHAIKAEESLRDERGETFFLSVKFPTRSTEGEITGICGISTDITQIKHYQKELERLSQYDELTGLCNRRHFMGLARHELGRSQRYGGKLSLLMVDIDHFKRVNDSHGHRTGDLVLAAVSEQIRKALRDADIAGRLGGEEFAVMLPETAWAAPFWSPSGCASRSRPRPSISATARHCSAPCRLAWPAWTTRRLTWKSCCTAPTRRFTAPRTAAATRSSATLPIVRRKEQPDTQRDQRQRPPFPDQGDEIEFEQVEIDAQRNGADDDQGDGSKMAFHAGSPVIRRGGRRPRLRRRGSASACAAAAAGW